MLRSLMTAVTGVKAHQTMLDVTGNNIANVNTTGYKKDFTIFQDLLYQTSQGASGPGANRGGINPAQVGLGVIVSSIETIHTQGPAQYTGNKSDMMINGDGFFVLRSGSSTLFSRAGAFGRDEENNLVQSGTGYRVQGYKMERDPLNPQNFVRASELSDINIPMGKKMEPRATTVVKYQCNLNSNSANYLPIGFEDLPYNVSPCGLPATVKMEGADYNISFKTNLDDKDKYLTVEVSSGSGTPNNVVLKMVGIEDGKPQLEVVDPDTEYTLPGSNPVVKYKASYDNTTGEVKFTTTEIGGTATVKTIFKTGLHSKMHYKDFTLKDKDGKEVKVLAEFDERVPPSPSEMGKSSMTVHLWYMDSDGKITHGKAAIPVNAAGNFEFDKAVPKDLPPGFPDGTFRIIPSGGTGEKVSTSSTISFEVDKNLTTPSKSFDSVAQIAQGGFHQTKKEIFDCKGNKYTLEVNFKKITENRWRWEAFLLDSAGNKMEKQPCTTDSSSTASGNYGASGEISFCRCGEYCDVETSKAELELPFSLDGGKNQTITLNFNGDGDPMNGVTQFASETTTKAVYQDGYTMGVLDDFNVGVDGTISGTYSNGQVQPLYRVALATFANQQGLEKAGETAFIPTINSGEPNIDAADSGGKGTIKGGTLEMSNVDLTEEFTRLIISQRGFQANTRVVTTSDQILEEVVNLKR